jgi:hypothetical protein
MKYWKILYFNRKLSKQIINPFKILKQKNNIFLFNLLNIININKFRKILIIPSLDNIIIYYPQLKLIKNINKKLKKSWIYI